MSRSRNSRRGARNRHGGRHHTCGVGCSYCMANFTAAERRQAAKADPEGKRPPRKAAPENKNGIHPFDHGYGED